MPTPYPTYVTALLYGELHHQIWLKGHAQIGYDPNQLRKDDFGNWMDFDSYGDRNAPFGWEIDHIVPSSLGGADEPLNMRPLHWRANSKLGGLLG